MPQFSFDDVPAAIPDTPEVTTGDFAKTFAAGAADVGSGLAGGARMFYEAGKGEQGAEIARGFQEIFGAGGDAARDTMNPEARQLLTSAMTSQEFWDRPLLATALKTTGMLPSVVALAVPAGLLADTVAATVAVAGGGAALAAGQPIDEFYKKLDAMPDADLQAQSQKYAALREVLDEPAARAKFAREAQGWAPAINAILGAGTAVVGPAGIAARRIAGGTGNVIGAGERGALGAGVVGAAEGASTNALQGGVSDVLSQQADVEANFAKDIDYARAANAAIEGGALGGLLGGVAGTVLHGRAPSAEEAAKGTAKLDKADAVEPVATNDLSAPQVQSGRASATPSKPLESAQVGNPQSAPARSDRAYPKKAGKAAGEPVVEQTAPAAPDTTQAAAIEASEPATETPDVAGALARLTAEQPPVATPAPAPEPVTPQVSGRPVPENVQAAVRDTMPQPVDTGQNVQESADTISAQIAQIGTGGRKAVMFPKGTAAPTGLPPGLKKTKNARGSFIFDPRLTSVKEINALSKAGRENELLGLGPVAKNEAIARAMQGEQPVVVTERMPDGTEVKAAVGTDGTAPQQVQALEQGKTPGNVVAVEDPGRALANRAQSARNMVPEPPRTGRVLRRIGDEDQVATIEPAKNLGIEKIKIDENLEPVLDTEGNAIPLKPEQQGKKRSKADIEALDQQKAGSAKIVEAHKPTDAEDGYLKKIPARDAVVARAQRMVDEAKISGVPIKEVLRRSIKGDAAGQDPNVQVLTLANELIKVKQKHPQGAKLTEAVGRFKIAETEARAGFSEDMLANRRAEGDEKMAARKSGSHEGMADDAAPKPEYREEAPVSEVAGEAPIEKAPTVKEAEDTITTASSGSKRPIQLDDGTEEVGGRSRAKAASGDKLAADAERKAALIAEMNAKYGTPKKNVTEKNALRVERNPTAAQIAAGNYKKGHRNVEGLDFSIENPKGAVRRGRGPDGEWKVSMPADYGYIRRTTGADGDHIDAYDGRSGSRYFIIDQLDHRTGKFDEHKVMMRFRDEAHARETYEKAFSDGRAADRLGHIQEVSLPELKEWLKQGNHEQSHLEHVVRDMDRVNFDVPEGPGIAVIGGGRVTPVRIARAADELSSLDFSKMPGVGGVLGKFFSSRLQKLAGDMEVHYIDQEAMDRISQGASGNLGLFIHNPGDALQGQLFISTAAKDGIGVGSRAHVLLHELAHQVTVREINSSPSAIRLLDDMMQVANKHLDENLQRYDLDENFRGKLDYGLTNQKEFIAEAFSNPAFQEFLTHIPAPPDMVKALKLGQARSVWDMFRHLVKRAIEKVTGEMPQFDSLLDSVMRVSENLTKVHEFEQLALRTGEEPHVRGRAEEHISKDALKLFTDASSAVEKLRRDANTMEHAPFALKLRTLDNIAKIADHYFGEANPVRKVYNAIEKMRVTSEGIFSKSEPLIKRMLDLRAKNGTAYAEFSALLHDATVANVHPDVPLTDAKNAHLGKKRIVGEATWSKSQHASLASRYNALPDDYKAAWHDVTKHFRDTQNKMSLGIIENRILKLMGIDDAALAKRIHEGTATDADRTLLGADRLEIIEQAGELSKIEGPYVPLMRRGDHVVKGRYKVAAPANAKALGGNEFEFTKESDATDYAKKSSLKATVKKVWVDETTGEMYETDPATGKEHKVSAKDLNAVPRYRVEVQNEHVEFVQGHRAAQRRADELAADGSLEMDKVVPRRFEVGGRQATELSASLQRLVAKLEKSEAYKQSTPTQKAMLRQAVEEAAAASHGSTRIASKALPRRGVVGYSEDLVKNLGEYGESSSRYLAKLEHMPEIEAGLKSIEERLKSDESKVNQYGRTAIRNEVVRRVQGDNGFEEGGDKFSPVVKRAMAISFIDKLASPAYSVINAMQPSMVTMPYLAGRHGVASTVTELGRAYNDLGSMHILKQGVKETARRLKGNTTPDDFVANAKAGLKSADERAMLDHMIEHGVVDPSAGMEVRNLTRDYTGVGGKVDSALSYLEGVTREMPRAVEAVNRMVSSLAAYRLERKRGGSHEQALQYAQDVVENTQFNYSPTNSAPFMNHPLAKMAFQFKKYGQGMYQLLGGQIGKAFRNASPGDRAEAVKTLIAIAGTHMAMAGALGLPTEPFKYLVMASGLVGGPQWGDVEDKIRKAAADVFGKTGGEVFSRGLPRLVNLDLSRMGLDSVTSFGEPRGGKDADVKSWFFDTLGGPIGGLAFDWGKGINLISQGDYLKGAEKLVPMKVASDTLRAYRQATEGKKKSSGAETSAPYNFQETVQRAAGFGSAREAEEGAAKGAYFRASTKQKEDRTALVDAWTSAKPEGKGKAMAAITKWNQSQPAEVKITPKELTSKLKKMDKDAKVGTLGVNPSRRDRHLLAERGYYNVN